MSDKPKSIFDPYGEEILPGKIVAYNYQGQVRIGKVVGWKPDPKRWGHLAYKISVLEQREGFTSTVTSPKNMVVITDKIFSVRYND